MNEPRRMNVHLHIECLQIDAGLRMDLQALQASVIESLSQALEQHSLPHGWQRQRRIRSLRGVPLRFGGPPSAWGGQLGRAVHSAVVGNAIGGLDDDSSGSSHDSATTPP